MSAPDELSPSDVAARLGTSKRTVQRWIADGKLPARRVGGRWRVASDAIGAFNRSNAIETVFVANRGEVAARIRRTANRLGIAVVVLGEDGRPEVDLLDAEAIVAAARSGGADSIHPGYGFLAESADFAERVVDAGLRWIGPPASAIRAVGDKSAARRLAVSLGIPVLPGYDDADQSNRSLIDAAQRIGWPVIVKPAAGGGGKGIHVVRELASLEGALAAGRREAGFAFGDERLILERYLEGPRHVEIQILFDTHGRSVHLGERDCSLQRRHQKVLEETPSPAVTETLRSRLGSYALALAGAVGYVSAGTCEFLLDDAGGISFLELNARLQVEHPVTEMVTGRDLVADQLRIAAGEPLGIDQAAVDRTLARGIHAIEVRLYAEDPEAGFLPATGRIEAVDWPTERDGLVRVDTAVAPGTEVDARFDPMLAKIVGAGRDRQEALTRLTTALDETAVLGLTTNLRFLRWLVRRPEVVGGNARIDTLERIWPGEAPPPIEPPTDAWNAAAWVLDGSAEVSADPWTGGWRLNAGRRLQLTTDDGHERSVAVGRPEAGLGPRTAPAVDGGVHVDVAGRSVLFWIAPPPDVDRAARAATDHHGTVGDILAPMPGSVIAVHVEPGAIVATGDPLVTIEAMKMEHVVAAPGPGIVREMAVAVGDQARRGQRIAEIGPLG